MNLILENCDQYYYQYFMLSFHVCNKLDRYPTELTVASEFKSVIIFVLFAILSYNFWCVCFVLRVNCNTALPLWYEWEVLVGKIKSGILGPVPPWHRKSCKQWLMFDKLFVMLAISTRNSNLGNFTLADGWGQHVGTTVDSTSPHWRLLPQSALR